MMKTKSIKRVVALIAVFAVICMVQTVAFADNTVNVYDGSYANGVITVTGSISTKGAEMTMLAIRTADENVVLDDYSTPDELTDDIMYIDQVTATSDNFEKTWEFELRDTGADGDYVVVFVSGTDAAVARLAIPLTGGPGPGFTVDPSNVTILVDEDAYEDLAIGEDASYALVKIVADVDYATASIEVAGKAFCYSMDKSAFYGIVDTADFSDLTEEAIAAAATKVDTAASVFYFGKVKNPTSPRDEDDLILTSDVVEAKKIILGTNSPSLAQVLAADVNKAEPNGIINAGDVIALKKNILDERTLDVVG